jgi:hypothetical protein
MVRERQQISSQLNAGLQQELFERFQRAGGDAALERMVEALLGREITPREAIEKLLDSDHQ